MAKNEQPASLNQSQITTPMTGADAVMVLDIVEQVLQKAESPGAASHEVCEILRELTGAQAVILLKAELLPGNERHQTIAATPQRRKHLAESHLVQSLAAKATTQTSPAFESDSETHQELLVTPLRTGSEYKGCIILLGLPEDEHGRHQLLRALELLSGTLTLVLRNASLFEDQEAVIADRTKELVAANERLLQKNLDLKLIEEELEKSEEKYRTLFQRDSDAIFIFDPETTEIVEANEATSRIYGYSQEELIGMPCLALSAEKEKSEAAIAKLSKNGEVAVLHRRHKKKDGTVFPVEITGQKIKLKDGDVMFAVSKDMTVPYRLQEQLNHSRKMDAIGQLAGGVAHDFNNMLNAIMSAAELLLSPHRQLDEKGKKYANMILKAATRAADLTAKLLAFGRKGEIDFKSVNLHEVLTDVLAILTNTIDKKIIISSQLGALNPVVYGHDSVLQNVFLNLAINASHAMDNGGELKITTRNTKLGQSHLSLKSFAIEPGEYVEVEVRDSGCGIPSEDLPKIFEPFFTTKGIGEGTGLGLAAAYGTIQDHHGAITVYSEIGTGTVFHIYLPCSTTQKKAIEKRTCHSTDGQGTILLVDDETDLREIGSALLEEMGYQVIHAENGQEAVNLYRRDHDAIDLVIMDMVMPVMNGEEAYHLMRDIDKQCPIVIASGFTKDKSLERMQKSGLVDFIQKPYRLGELSTLLSRLLPR